MIIEQRWTDMAYRICAINGPDLISKGGVITALAASLQGVCEEGRQSREVEVKALKMKISHLHEAGNDFLDWYMNRRGETAALTDLKSAISGLATVEKEVSDAQ